MRLIVDTVCTAFATIGVIGVVVGFMVYNGSVFMGPFLGHFAIVVR